MTRPEIWNKTDNVWNHLRGHPQKLWTCFFLKSLPKVYRINIYPYPHLLRMSLKKSLKYHYLFYCLERPQNPLALIYFSHPGLPMISSTSYFHFPSVPLYWKLSTQTLATLIMLLLLGPIFWCLQPHVSIQNNLAQCKESAWWTLCLLWWPLPLTLEHACASGRLLCLQ